MSPLESSIFSQRKFSETSEWEETKEMLDCIYSSPPRESQIPSAKNEVEKRKTEICRIWKSGKTCPFVSF
jgi:hypothetical protein